MEALCGAVLEAEAAHLFDQILSELLFIQNALQAQVVLIDLMDYKSNKSEWEKSSPTVEHNNEINIMVPTVDLAGFSVSSALSLGPALLSELISPSSLSKAAEGGDLVFYFFRG